MDYRNKLSDTFNRRSIQGTNGPRLEYAPSFQKQKRVGCRPGEAQQMGDKKHTDTAITKHSQLCQRFADVLYVQRRGNFIQEDILRLQNERPCDSNSLALSDGGLVRITVDEVTHIEGRNHSANLVDIFCASPALLQREQNVLPEGQMRPKKELLKYHCQLGPRWSVSNSWLRRKVVGLRANRNSSGIGRIEQRQGPKKCGLTAAARTDYDRDFTQFDCNIHIAQDCFSRERFGYSLGFEHVRGRDSESMIGQVASELGSHPQSQAIERKANDQEKNTKHGIHLDRPIDLRIDALGNPKDLIH